MKFVTFNIRCDFGQDGANNFIYRRPLILEKNQTGKAGYHRFSGGTAACGCLAEGKSDRILHCRMWKRKGSDR